MGRFQLGVLLHAEALLAVVFVVHGEAQHVVHRHVRRAGRQTVAAARRAVVAFDQPVVFFQQRQIRLLKRPARGVQIFVDLGVRTDGHHQAADVRVGQHPFERGLRKRLALGAGEVGQHRVARAFECLHGDHADALAFGVMEDGRQFGPVAEVVRDHDDVEAPGIDRVAHDALQPRRVRRDAQKAQLALFLEPVERFVDVRVHQPVDGIAGVDVRQVQVVCADAFEAGLDRGHDVLDRRVVAQVAVGRAEFGDDEQFFARGVADAVAQHFFRIGARIVGRGVEIVDAAVDRAADHVGVVQSGAAERDVGDLHPGAAERAIVADVSRLPARVFLLGLGLGSAQQKKLRLVFAARGQCRAAAEGRGLQKSAARRGPNGRGGGLGRFGRR